MKTPAKMQTVGDGAPRTCRGGEENRARAGDLVTGREWDRRWAELGDPDEGCRAPALRGRFRRAVIRYRELDRVLAETIDSAGKPRAEILELGCAPGAMLARVHRLRPQHGLHGIDASERGLAHARAALAAAGAEAVLHLGDARTVALPRRYDVVFSAGLVEHFADPAAVVKRHAELAEPGGVVLVTVPNFAHPAVRRMLARFSPETLRAHNLAIMQPEALRAALAAAGLSEISAGACEGPRLPGAAPGADGAGPGRLFRCAVRGWNLAAAFTPHFLRLWNFIIWGRGRVPPAGSGQ